MMGVNDRIKEAFDSIHAEEELRHSTRNFLYQKAWGRRKDRRVVYKRLVAALACACLVLFGAGGYVSYFMPASAISIDVNPSIELGVNRFDRVVSIEGYNEDGSALATALDIRFLPYTDALTRILADESMAPYLTADSLITITVMGSNEQKSSEILDKAAACAASHDNVYCCSANAQEAAAAHKAGMSFGKYRAYLEWQALDPHVAVDDARGMTMRQIRDRIAELSNGAEHSTSDGQAGKGREHGRFQR